MKTILILLPFEPSSGAGGRKSEAIGTLIKAHENIGYNVITATSIPDQEHVTELYKFDAPTDRILACLYAKFSNKKLKNVIKRLWFKRVSFFTREYVKSKPIDLVFAYSMTADTNLLAYKIFIDNQIPYVINEHRSTYQGLLSAKKHLPKKHIEGLNKALVVLALTEQHRSSIEHFTSTPVRVMPLVLENDFIERNDRNFKDENIFTIGAWTNWREIKRVDLLVKAFSIFAKNLPESKLIIGGPIPDIKGLGIAKNIIESEGLEGKVEFWGELNREGIHKLLSVINCSVITSEYESFGIPATEALASGVPVISTKCGGPESFIVDGVNGYIVNRNDAQDIATKLKYISDNKDQLNLVEIMENAREEFSILKLQRLISNIYEDLN